MVDKWADDVKKHVADADDRTIAAIVKYCGIALRRKDSALVSFSDKAEVARLREKFLKKKLQVTLPDTDLDEAITAVRETMKADRLKNRVTVYYLLAARFGKLGVFV